MIEVCCPNCGKKSSAPDAYAGKRAKCPKCQQTLTIQQLTTQDQIVVPQNNISQNESLQPVDVPAAPKTKACPYCSEQILETARKCKHCGEFLEGEVKFQKQFAAKTIVQEPWSKKIYAILVVSTLVVPLVGICAGIYGLTQQAKRKQGMMLLTGTIGWIITIYSLASNYESTEMENLFGTETATKAEFPASKIRQGIEKTYYLSSNCSYFVKGISINKTDDLEFPYAIAITVTSRDLSRPSSDLAEQGVYTFKVDEDLKLSDNYTVRGGERQSERDGLVECLQSVLRNARTGI